MKLIGSRAGYHVDDGSAGEAIFRGEVGLLDLEFFHGIHRGRVKHILNSAVLIKIRRARAIDQNVSGGVPAPIGIEVDPPLRIFRPRCVRLGDAWSQIGKISEISVDERQIVNEPPVDHLARDGVLGL